MPRSTTIRSSPPSPQRAVWVAERTRLAGASDPAAWEAAARAWAGLCCPHRAGYAWWRHAEAQLAAAGQDRPAAETALRTAAAAADGHAPLLAQIRKLAGRAASRWMSRLPSRKTRRRPRFRRHMG